MWRCGTEPSNAASPPRERFLDWFFYTALVVTLGLNVLFITVPASVLTGAWGVNRALLLPTIFGLPVVAVTGLTFLSARWRVPLVLIALVALGGLTTVRGLFAETYYAVRTVDAQPLVRPTLKGAAEQWAKANDCELPKDGADVVFHLASHVGQELSFERPLFDLRHRREHLDMETVGPHVSADVPGHDMLNAPDTADLTSGPRA